MKTRILALAALVVASNMMACGDEGSTAPPVSSTRELISASAFTESSLRSGFPQLSANGLVLLFKSADEYWVRDLDSDTVERASDISTTVEAQLLSSDGHLVLVTAVDANYARTIFLRDRSTGETTTVSINAAGTARGNGDSNYAVASADGRYIVFESNATDLVSGIADVNHASDVYVRDLESQTSGVVSVNAAGTATGNQFSSEPQISANGRYVAFRSGATDLLPDRMDNCGIFVRSNWSNSARQARQFGPTREGWGEPGRIAPAVK